MHSGLTPCRGACSSCEELHPSDTDCGSSFVQLRHTSHWPNIQKDVCVGSLGAGVGENAVVM
eukprot:1656-Pelagomonas_calceolata.AAC.7